MNDINLSVLIKSMPIFSQFSTVEIDQLIPKSQQLRLKKTDILFNKADVGSQVFFVIFGKIKLYHEPTPQNSMENIFRIVPAGESFAEAVAFLRRPFPVSAQALEDSLVLGFKVDSLIQLMQNNTTLALKMLAGLSLRVHTLHDTIDSLRTQSGMERCIYYLISLTNETQTAPQKLNLITTKQNTASLLNIKPETFSRYLAILEKNNLIKVDGREIEIQSVAQLKEYCHSDKEAL